MAIDINRTVTTTYKAITDQHEQALEKLKGKTKESETSFGEWAKGLNEHLNHGMEALGKFNQAFEGLNKLVEIGAEGLRAYGDDLRLTAAAGSTDIERLSEAFHGLSTEHDVLSFAAKANHGVMKLSQEQMELVGEAAVSLTRQGFDQADAFEKLEGAAISLKTKGLEQLGISVEHSTDKGEQLNNIMMALHATIDKGKDLVPSEAEDVERLSVAWKNAKENVEKYIGATLSLSALKNGRGAGFDVVNVLTFGQAERNLEARKIREANASASLISMPSQSDIDAGKGGDSTFDPYQLVDQIYGLGLANDAIAGKAEARLTAFMEKSKKDYAAAEAMAKILAAQRRTLANKIAKESTDTLLKQLTDEAVATEGQASLDSASAAIHASMQTGGIVLPANTQAIIDKAGADSAQNERQTKSTKALAKVFGPIGDFDLYKEAFKSLEGAVSSSMNAWIDGSMSAGEAFKKFIGDAVKGLASQMLVEAIKNTAYAIGSLVPGPTFNPPAAAGYFLAAAEFAAGAATAAIVAKELGAGGGSTSSASAGKGGGAGSSAPSTLPANSNTQPQGDKIIVYADSYADDSPRMKTLKAQKLLALAGIGNGVTGG